MNREAAGAIADFLGGGVVVSIVYLAAPIRRSNRQSQGSKTLMRLSAYATSESEYC
ncbi:MAG: hypothetical protein JRH01_13745 [Deltaproteobacteria bacterium]|nr:hypothetical protein [Deltaproteobacteria bacterium]